MTQPKDKLTAEPVIQLTNVVRSYVSVNDERLDVLRGVNLSIYKGDFIAIRGESGSGKTTLLRVLGLLDVDYEGHYTFIGRALTGAPGWLLDEIRATAIGFVFQEGRLFTHLCLRDNIELPRRLRPRPAVEPAPVADNPLATLIKLFYNDQEIADGTLDRRPWEVSGGQRQRAALWRAIGNQPSVILADEPTANLDPKRKQEILKLFRELSDRGHTVVVVSHDSVFLGAKRVYELREGRLNPWPHREAESGEHRSDQADSPAPVTASAGGAMPVADCTEATASDAPDDDDGRLESDDQDQTWPSVSECWWGLKPRVPVSMLLRFAMRELYLRPMFLLLILGALVTGAVQATVFLSILDGTQQFVDYAINTGSRLTRLEIKPRPANLGGKDRFPDRGDVSALPSVSSVVGRRETTLWIFDKTGRPSVRTVLGLHEADPEYGHLDFAAGGGFSIPTALEVIVTESLLHELFDTTELRAAKVGYDAFLGREVQGLVRQYNQAQVVRAEAKPSFKIVGIIAHGEAGRQVYLPNTTLLAFDKWRSNRDGTLTLPLAEDGRSWLVNGEEVTAFAAFPWEDRLHVYVRSLREVLPTFRTLSKWGYRPQSEIFDYEWVLDVREMTTNILTPLLIVVTLIAGLTIYVNISTSGQIREKEYALLRVLGMRVGDLAITQIMSAILTALAGISIGVFLGWGFIIWGRNFLNERFPDEQYAQIFAPIDDAFFLIVAVGLGLSIAASVWPALRVGLTKPAKILESS